MHKPVQVTFNQLVAKERQSLNLTEGQSANALCLSGGGIRSATFALGVIHGLARHGYLKQFDYLSTVSGGGFAGSWLSAWIPRAGIDSVIRRFAAASKTAIPVTKSQK